MPTTKKRRTSEKEGIWSLEYGKKKGRLGLLRASGEVEKAERVKNAWEGKRRTGKAGQRQRRHMLPSIKRSQRQQKKYLTPNMDNEELKEAETQNEDGEQSASSGEETGGAEKVGDEGAE